jgi:hypothetical protein
VDGSREIHIEGDLGDFFAKMEMGVGEVREGKGRGQFNCTALFIAVLRHEG